MECFLWSTVLADNTPMISTGMVLCDRHYGGINYPIGGVGEIARLLVQGLQVSSFPHAQFCLFSSATRLRDLNVVVRVAGSSGSTMQERGGQIAYKAPVERILTEPGEDSQDRAVGVRLRDGREIRSKLVVSNATRYHSPSPLLLLHTDLLRRGGNCITCCCFLFFEKC